MKSIDLLREKIKKNKKNSKLQNELIELLENKTNEANIAYYTKSKSIMSDVEYDKLIEELKMLKSGLPIIEEMQISMISPLDNVGTGLEEIVSSLKKVVHDKKMLSLSKTKEVEELKSFLGNREGLLSWKIDGLTIVLIYEKGKLVKGITRGNGVVGEDITHNVKVFENIPLEIKYKGRLSLRGEAVIKYKDFDEINNKLEEKDKYKNPRNLCSGTVRLLDNERCKERRVNFIGFKLIYVEDRKFIKKEEELKFLKEEGFEIVESVKVTKDTIEKAVIRYEEEVVNIEYATDGLVLTFDDIKYSEDLGVTSKTPKDSLAFKWTDELVKTKLLEVIWQCSRTGSINPIAVFEDVEIEGTTVGRASLHNLSYVKQLKLGIGDEIMVYKANMIIPQLEKNLTKSDTLEIPTNCPLCNEKLDVVEQKEGEVLFCSNENCKGKIVKKLVHFVSRDCMNIEGLSEGILEKLNKVGIIKNIKDIYILDNKKEEIINIEGLGEKSYNKMIESINKSKETYLYNFINSLGINQVGLNNSKLLVEFYDNDINKIIKSDIAGLESVEGFGEVIAKNVVSYFEDEKNVLEVMEIVSQLKLKTDEKKESSITGLTFVITGSVNSYKNRKELQKDIENLGGKVVTSVSSKVNYLINNDKESGSSKNKKAKELGIKIIREDEFIKMKEV